MATRRKPGPSTRAIHADRPHNPTRGVAPAIFQTATFRWDAPEDGLAQSYETAPPEFYSRWGNPNVRQLEALVAALEGAEAALATASGMAAAALCVLPFVQAGDHVVCARALYGDVHNLATKVLPRWGVECTVLTQNRTRGYAEALRPNTRVVLIESPANPTLECVPIADIAGLCRERGVRLVVDSTFATPFNTRPLELGAHAVFHSATKYLAGHSDVIAGVLATDAESVARSWEYLRMLGPCLGPFEAWLVARGLRTFPMRMERHNVNAYRVAQALAKHPAVSRVYYPGLPSHPTHTVARAQMSGGYGGVVALELREGVAHAQRFVGALELFVLATSLGGVESLVQFPATLSRLTEAEQRAAGIAPGMVRLSVGCEDGDDLLEDLARALEA